MPSVIVSHTLQLHQVEKAAKRYHYQEWSQKQALFVSYQDMKIRISPKASYEILNREDQRASEWAARLDQSRKRDGQGIYMAGIVTLGEAVDQLQDMYSQRGDLLMAYGVEVLGMEWLALWTEELIHHAAHALGLHQGRVFYPGEEIPLESIAQLLRLFPDIEVGCNSAYVMHPKKTVLFLAALEEEAGTCPNLICGSCRQRNCQYRRQKKNNRELNYGYQRIFGT